MYRFPLTILTCPGGVFKERIGSPRLSLGQKVIKRALDQRECEGFEIPLQHKSKLRVYRQLKWEIGFDEYKEYVKRALSILFLKFRSNTRGLFMELGRHVKGGRSLECRNCRASKESVERVLFECTSYDSQRLDFKTT